MTSLKKMLIIKYNYNRAFTGILFYKNTLLVTFFSIEEPYWPSSIFFFSENHKSFPFFITFFTKSLKVLLSIVDLPAGRSSARENSWLHVPILSFFFTYEYIF